jgi:hypothetical protein
MSMRLLTLVTVAASGLVACGCETTRTAPPAKAAFRFSVAEAYYHDRFREVPEPNVVAAGTVRLG